MEPIVADFGYGLKESPKTVLRRMPLFDPRLEESLQEFLVPLFQVSFQVTSFS